MGYFVHCTITTRPSMKLKNTLFLYITRSRTEVHVFSLQQILLWIKVLVQSSVGLKLEDCELICINYGLFSVSFTSLKSSK